MAGFGDLMKIMAHAKELQESAKKMKEELPKMDKLILADMILDHILKLEEPTE